jgi:hypothetical protein
MSNPAQQDLTFPALAVLKAAMKLGNYSHIIVGAKTYGSSKSVWDAGTMACNSTNLA